MLRDLDLAFMRLHVLYHAVQEPFYGAATPEGEAVLDTARAKLEELTAEVLYGEGPGPLADPSDDASIDPPSS